jgi:hypothetical protein
MSYRSEWIGSESSPEGTMKLYLDDDFTPTVVISMPNFAVYHQLVNTIRKIENDARSQAINNIYRKVKSVFDVREYYDNE